MPAAFTGRETNDSSWKVSWSDVDKIGNYFVMTCFKRLLRAARASKNRQRNGCVIRKTSVTLQYIIVVLAVRNTSRKHLPSWQRNGTRRPKEGAASVHEALMKSSILLAWCDLSRFCKMELGATKNLTSPHTRP